MTWDEFKAAVDAALKEQGHDGSIEVWYVDAAFPEPGNFGARATMDCSPRGGRPKLAVDGGC